MLRGFEGAGFGTSACPQLFPYLKMHYMLSFTYSLLKLARTRSQLYEQLRCRATAHFAQEFTAYTTHAKRHTYDAKNTQKTRRQSRRAARARRTPGKISSGKSTQKRKINAHMFNIDCTPKRHQLHQSCPKLARFIYKPRLRSD